MMISRIQKSKLTKVIAVYLAFCLVTQVFIPNVAFALTSGPSQPEVQSFEPIGTTEMVDPFSGDFTYNIPLIDVGGYPVNISYHSGITMDQEASWVGLGWNINPGVINRNMRGIPDDFNGDKIQYDFNIKNNFNISASFSPNLEIIGIENPAKDVLQSLNVQTRFNNYTGVGINYGVDLKASSFRMIKSDKCMDLGIGLTFGSDGIGVQPRISFSGKINESEEKERSLSGSLSLNFNSRAGLTALTFSSKITKTEKSLESAKKSGRNTKILHEVNGGSPISFTNQTYTPSIQFPMVNVSFSFEATLGFENWGLHPNARLSGSFSGQYLKTHQIERQSYGYLYSHKSEKNDNVLDFNREKDGSYTKNTTNLPLTNFSYDIYSVSGQGIGGMYRPFRSDVGIVHDPEVKTFSGGLNFPGLEIGFPNTIRGGANFSLDFATSRSGKWEERNNIKDIAKFAGFSSTPSDYEPYYFKQAGEKTAESDESFFWNSGGFRAVQVDVDKNTGIAERRLKDGYQYSNSSLNFKRYHRQRRNEAIITLNNIEASKFGLNKQIENYPKNDFVLNTEESSEYYHSYEPVLAPRAKADHPYHISEITANRADGARYVYGIPAYNNKQVEATFAISGGATSTSTSTGLVTYSPGVDNSKDNKNGLDHYYNSTTLPPFAHSYLLTAVLSADYVDVDNNGPTPNDIGGYTKFNYLKKHDNYRWRVPYSANKANWNEGLKTKGNTDPASDDKASYVYGEKEVWYMHSIETKTHVAEFYLSERKDSYGVLNEDGGYDSSMHLLKLDKIKVYSKQDKIQNGANAVPIKTVHFVYDYSLCQGVPNNCDAGGSCYALKSNELENQGGKLTLKEIYFTYGESDRGKLHSYKFDYGKVTRHYGGSSSEEIEINPDYNLKGYDRWGNYSPNPGYDSSFRAEFPYVNQELIDAGETYDENLKYNGSGNSLYDSDQDYAFKADLHALSWNLTDIKLPSGGKIKVEYEADDYAYVQDRRAMQMFKVCGAIDAIGTGKLMSEISGYDDCELYTLLHNNNYLIIEFPDAYSSTYTDAEFKQDYLIDENNKLIEDLYFRFLIDLENPAHLPKEEFISGYAKLGNNHGLLASANGDKTHAYIELDSVKINDADPKCNVNPISQTAWNFIRLNLPSIATRAPDVNDKAHFLDYLKILVTVSRSLVDMISGYNFNLRMLQHAQNFDASNSFIRLYSPDGFKKGGGVRVKRITISDEWNKFTGGPVSSNYSTKTYGQEYSYTTTNDKGVEISSGVAAYEPMVGGEENPFRSPKYMEERHLMVPDDRFFVEYPFGESFFPSASVGYSKVTVSSLKHADITKHATGKVVHEFYTAKDFPVQTTQTPLDVVRKVSNPLMKLLKVYLEDKVTTSQGYQILLNDMHGKPKSQKVYAEDSETAQSGLIYKYKTKSACSKCVDILNNKVDVIFADGSIEQKYVGIDHDMVIDMQEHSSVARSGGLGSNVDGFLVSLIPLIIPTFYPTYFEERTQFRSVVTTKVINQYGLIDEVEAFDNSSRIVTKNLLYDGETGEVLLTETINAFEDPVYSFKYPAHWVYKGMGPAYTNLGFKADSKDPKKLGEFLFPGDEISFHDEIYWVRNVPVNDYVKIYNRNGQVFDLKYDEGEVRVLRSGHRNMQNTPVGNIVTLTNPLTDIDNDGDYDELNFDKVLNAGSTEFTNYVDGVFCDCGIDESEPQNPYLIGTKGNWKPIKPYVYLTDRTLSRVNKGTNIRDDGVYKAFNPFWQLDDNAKFWYAKYTNWIYTTEVSIFSPYGVELENVDALERPSSATYGYNYLLPTAVGANAEYKEIGFDGFEDYGMDNCTEDHFGFEGGLESGKVEVNSDASHSGKNSLKVTKGNTATMTKSVTKKFK